MSWSRRGVLGAALGVAGLGAARAQAQSAATPAPRPAGAGAVFFNYATTIHSELRQIAPNVYAFLQREAPGQSNLSVSNFGIIAGPRSLLAIDAGGGPVHARNFIAAAKPLGRPFDRVVITHEHPDHIVGLTQFPAGIEIVAHEATRAQMVKMGPARTPAHWKTNAAWGSAEDVNRIILPTVTFRDRMSVYYGDTQVDFVWPGRAHTSGDALVYVPGHKVLFMGDIGFFGITPLNGSGFIAEWIALCDRIIADPQVQTIVPGHGPVGGKAELGDMRDYLALLYREGRKGLDAGISAGRAAAQVDLGKYASWTDADRLPTNMARLYLELRGALGAGNERDAARQAVEEYDQLKGRR